MSVYDVLMERGFIKQMSHEDEIKELLATRRPSSYRTFGRRHRHGRRPERQGRNA